MTKYIVLVFVLFVSFISLTEERTEQDLRDFIASDKTNDLAYSDDFDCKEFSETVMSNARREGFEAFTVWVAMRSNGNVGYHVFTGFEVEGGIIWIEPQNDREYDVSGLGEALCYTDGECVAEEILYIRYE